MRLWHALTLLVNVIILIAFLGYGAYTANELSRYRTLELQRETLNVASAIAAGAANDLLTNRYDNIESMLLLQAKIGSVEELIVADVSGQIITQVKRSTTINAEGKSKDEAKPQVTYPLHTTTIALNKTEYHGIDSYTRLLPIERIQHLGWVRVTTSLTGLSEMRHQIWLNSLLASLLTVLVVGTLLTLLLRQAGRALEEASLFAGNLIHQRGASIETRSWVREITALKIALNAVSQALTRQFQALQDSEARKGAILEASLDCLITIDADDQIYEFNPAAETVFGYRRDEAIGQKMGDLIVPPAHRAAHQRGMDYYLATGIGPALRKRIEMTALRRNGNEFPVELSVVPFEDGGRQYFLGSIRDISERKSLEGEQQRMNTMLLQTVSDLAAQQYTLDEHAIVTIADLEGNIVYANEKFCKISGYPLEELLNKNHRILKSGLHDAALYEQLWSTITAGRTWHGEIANRRKDGSIFWVAATIVPTPGKDGLPHQYIAIRTDITQQKLNEQQLDLYRQHLENMVEQYRESQLNLDRARARELAIGNQIQRSLLFAEVPANIGTLSIATYTEPSKGIDGDFYEFFSYSPTCFDLSIGDVMGKGIPAALIGAAVKQQMNLVIAEQLTKTGPSGHTPGPAELMNALNAKVGHRLIQLDSFITLAYMRIDLLKNTATFVDAGHTRVIHTGADGLRLLHGDNLPLGVMEDEHYVQNEVSLRTGDLMFLYSDGITEARNPAGEEYGVERLCELVQTLHTKHIPSPILIQAVRRTLRDYEQIATLSDDRTCIAMQLNDHDDSDNPPRYFELPWRLNTLSLLRQEIERMAHRAALSDDARDALTLAAFEACTNVIRHSSRRLHDATLHGCLADHDDFISLTLHYLGENYTPSETEPDFSGESEGGFGLFIIRNSVDEVIYDSPLPGINRIYLRKNKVR